MNKKTVNLRACEVRLKDGTTPLANQLSASDIDGDVEFTLAGYEPIHIMDRGFHKRTNQGPLQLGTFTLTENFALFSEESAGTPVSAIEALTGSGGADGWVPVNESGDYFTVTMEIYLPAQIGDPRREIIVLNEVGLDPNINVTLSHGSKMQLTGFHKSTLDTINRFEDVPV